MVYDKYRHGQGTFTQYMETQNYCKTEIKNLIASYTATLPNLGPWLHKNVASCKAD